MRLNEIPNDLSELFKDILRRDNEDTEALLLCILWILYAKRPLQPKELYHAVWFGLSLKGLADLEIPDLTGPDADDSADRYVISSSKGLAELTKSHPPTVQFIHESVRDFLVKDRGLQELWPDLGFDLKSPTHERLKQYCYLYMNHTSVRESANRLLLEERPDRKVEILKQYPFWEYASQHLLHHANAAADVIPQDEFLSGLSVPEWIRFINFFTEYGRYPAHPNLFYILAKNGCSKLIRTRLKEDPHVHVHVSGERYQYPLFVALAKGHKDAAAALLNTSSTTCFEFRFDDPWFNPTPLSWAAREGRRSIVQLILQTGIMANELDTGGQTALSRAAEYGHESVAKLLVEHGADVNACDRNGGTPLDRALRSKHELVARFLIEKGADVNARNQYGQTPLYCVSCTGDEAMARLLIEKGANVPSTALHRAILNHHVAVARLLIEKGADVKLCNDNKSTPLHGASSSGQESIARLLIEYGADVNAYDGDQMTPLRCALSRGHEAVAELLIEKGAKIDVYDNVGWTPLYSVSFTGNEVRTRALIEKWASVNWCDVNGWTPLHSAAHNGHEAVATLLIEKGANVNACNINKLTPLMRASRNGHEAVARLLIEKGADVNSCDNSKQTSLLHASQNADSSEGIARLLIQKGADVNACDKNRWTALTWAVLNRHEAMVQLLVENGAVQKFKNQALR